GSQESIKEIKKLDELYIVTSRAEDLKCKTQEWLDIYFPRMFSKLLFCNTFSNNELKQTSKRQLCAENGILLLLEDHYDYAVEVSKEIPVILFDKPWNSNKQNLDNIIRVYNWNQAVAAAKHLYRKKINPSFQF
ncbi:MAG: hypothetical protein QXO70_01110, partial [Candidatus Pacearchaeota archaeon]